MGEYQRLTMVLSPGSVMISSCSEVQSKVKVSPTTLGSQPHPHLLVCSVTGFYPGGIEIQWLKNRQEQTAGVVSTELLQNGDWTFQILVMLEMRPRRGDVYTCQVEHVSLRGPLAVHWGKSLWVWGSP
ncbi:4-aminobutyrate aminotransferase [Platysternon megacephalum]|uniref:4-aminobutyrate aminotransferase n=1 Tax=Platysternon megacephalum TaxID=55544 RepID=A0A4D9DEV8_9SAUR|nr:4-aminobutyrate aminotransferase [Platysternon megacephalum]